MVQKGADLIGLTLLSYKCLMYIKGLLNSPSCLKRLHKEWSNPQCITMLDMSVCENETDELVKIIEQKNESTPSLIGQFFFLLQTN